MRPFSLICSSTPTLGVEYGKDKVKTEILVVVVVVVDLLEDRRITDVIIGNFCLCYLKHIDSMFPWYF